jgi:hypothetical protein
VVVVVAKKGTFGKLGTRPHKPEPLPEITEATTTLMTERARGTPRSKIPIPFFGIYPWKVMVMREGLTYHALIEWCQEQLNYETDGYWRIDKYWAKVDGDNRVQMADALYLQTEEAAVKARLFLQCDELHFTERSKYNPVKRPDKIANQFDRKAAAAKGWETIEKRSGTVEGYAEAQTMNRKRSGRKSAEEQTIELMAAVNGENLPPNWLVEARQRRLEGSPASPRKAKKAEPEQTDLEEFIAKLPSP